jgi:hypothetical protein
MARYKIHVEADDIDEFVRKLIYELRKIDFGLNIVKITAKENPERPKKAD